MTAPRVALYGHEEDFSNYRAALLAADCQPVFVGSRVPTDCDGLLLAGGGDPDPCRYGQTFHGAHPPDAERDQAEFELLSRFFTLERPILGICRGMQMINIFCGGTLLQDISGHGQRRGRDTFHDVENIPNSFADRLYGLHCTVNSAHHQAIDRPGRALDIVQWAGRIPEALVHRTLPILAVQYHPERMLSARSDAADGMAVFRWFRRMFR